MEDGIFWEKTLRINCEQQHIMYLGVNCYLRSVQDHYNLRRWTPEQDSQITFQTINGKRCFVYREDYISKTHDGGLGDMKSDRKEVVVFPNDDPTRDPVRID